MFTKPYWIDGPWSGRLAVSPRPRGGDWLEDELNAWRESGVHVVVSLLESEEANDLGLEKEEEHSQARGIVFHSLPTLDRSVPQSLGDLLSLLQGLEKSLNAGKRVVIHCRQGIGRAGVVAVCLLLRRVKTLDEAIACVTAARRVPVPETAEQLEWLRAHEREIVGSR
jgi:protein-tyrosine phosphatase